MIRKLSREYAAMLNQATNPDCPAPYAAEVEVVDQTALRDKFRQMSALRRKG